MDDSNQNRLEMLLGNCLNCQGLVRIPVTAPATQKVRCPHCTQSFFLSQILEHSVPELEIVDDSVAETPTVPHVDKVAVSKADEMEEREAFVVPPQLSKGAKRRRSSRSSSERDESSNTSGSRSRSRSSRSTRESSRSSSPSRRQAPSQQKSSVLEMMKVLVGGALAIPIAYMLVFWVFHQDPLDIGPSIGNVAPFLVPEQLRGDSDVESGEARGTEANPIDGDTEKLTVPSLDPDKVLKDIGS